MEHQVPQLGRLTSIDIREVWTSEPYAFDPWLIQPENLQFLADALGLPGLEVVQTQAAVGPFYADVVARVAGTDHHVVIENQLDKADHRHLGQVLTYAPQFDARICVWVASQICDEHRAAVDWLNRITGEGYAFFGVEVRAVKIGDSLPAPLFEVVARPNEWARVTSASSASGEPLSADASSNVTYWSQLHDYLVEANLPYRQTGKPLKYPTYWIPIGLGSDGYLWAFRSLSKAPYVTVGISLYGEIGGQVWNELKERAEELNTLTGEPLEWSANSKGTAFHVQLARRSGSLDVEDWPNQHNWLIEKLSLLNAKLVNPTTIAFANARLAQA